MIDLVFHINDIIMKNISVTTQHFYLSNFFCFSNDLNKSLIQQINPNHMYVSFKMCMCMCVCVCMCVYVYVCVCVPVSVCVERKFLEKILPSFLFAFLRS
jgi:hypothetical protein